MRTWTAVKTWNHEWYVQRAFRATGPASTQVAAFLTLRQLMWANQWYESAEFLYYTQRPYTAFGRKEVLMRCDMPFPRLQTPITARLTATSYGTLLPQEGLERSTPAWIIISSAVATISSSGHSLRWYVSMYMTDGLFNNKLFTEYVYLPSIVHNSLTFRKQ
jgi:hypothetical protein